MPHLCGATLLALHKKSGGLRPIAVGEVLRRLASKCLANSVRSQILSSLSPLQMGVGVKGGCEAIIHTASLLLASKDTNICWTLLLDFSNAFNSVNREAMFTQFRKHIPGLSAWMESCYSGQPLLLLGEDIIHSCSGVQQGDPLGPLGFALTLHLLAKKVKAEVPDLALNIWYLDDGTLMGSPDDLAAALDIVEKEGPSLGLHLNRSKSLLYIPKEEDESLSPLPSDIPTTRDGFTLLGCPIGPPSYCEGVFQTRLERVKTSLGHLRDMADAQLEMTLLRSCLALPKVSFVLRACPPSHIHHSTNLFDATIRHTLEDIVGGPVSDWSWLKAGLPSSLGGLNLRSASLHAPAAFIASTSASQPLVEQILGHTPSSFLNIRDTVSALAAAAVNSNWLSLEDIDVPLRQHSLSAVIDKAIFDRLLVSAPSIRSRALALSSSLPHAGDWLNVVPADYLGLHLRDRELRCCLRYWLGTPMHSKPYPCPECRSTADPFGDHQVGCGGNGDRISHHNAVRDVLFSAAQSAALAPSKETPGLIISTLSRPADILLPNWSRGCPAALDFHVISPLQDLTVAEASFTPGHALQVGVRRKLDSSLSACREAGLLFVPLVAESLGGLAEDTISTIRIIGQAISDRCGTSDRATTTKQLFSRVAIALWRGCGFTGYHHLPPSLTVLLNYVFCFCFVLFLIPFTGCYVASGKGAGHFKSLTVAVYGRLAGKSWALKRNSAAWVSGPSRK